MLRMFPLSADNKKKIPGKIISAVLYVPALPLSLCQTEGQATVLLDMSVKPLQNH